MTTAGEEFRRALKRRFKDAPDGLGIQFKDARLTNSELEAALARLARDWGRLHGVRVVLLLPDSLEAYLLYLHLFLEGAVLVPVSVQAVGPRIAEICERVRADVVVTNEFLFQAHRAVLQNHPCLVVRGARKETRGKLDCELLNSRADGPGTVLGPVREDEVVRFIIFTSGSTGTPKGVCLSEVNILSAARMMVEFLPLDATTLSLVTVPLYDYYGMIQVFGHILGGGGYIFGHNTSLPAPLLGAITSLGATDLVLVPHTLRTLLAGPAAGPAFGALRRLTSSSDMLTEDLLQKLFEFNPDATMVNIYGLTEAGRACYRKIRRDTPPSKSIGLPSPGVEIEIRDPAGEIVIRGPNVMLGYLTGLDGDRLRFEPRSEMVTGDVGYREPNGEIVLLGRRDHVINLMGMKMHPCEIEMAALRAGLADARVRVVSDARGEKVIHLEAVRQDSTVTDEHILRGLRASLPRAFVPATVTFVEAIPRTDVGAKILR